MRSAPILVALWLHAGLAGAASLHYVRQAGAEGCLDEATLRAAVATRLGRDPFAREETLAVTVTIAPGDGGLVATIELRDVDNDAGGSHRLLAPGGGCGDLAQAIVLALSIAVAAEPPPRPATVPPPRSSPVPPPPPRVRLRLALDGLASFGLSPTVATFAATLGGGVQIGRWSVDLEARVDAPLRHSLLPQWVGEISTSLVAGEVVPCVHVALFAACALAVAGVSFGSGRGFVAPREVSAPFVAFGARVGLEIPLARRLALRLHGDLLVPVTLLALTVDNEVVFRYPPVSGALGVGLLVMIP